MEIDLELAKIAIRKALQEVSQIPSLQEEEVSLLADMGKLISAINAPPRAEETVKIHDRGLALAGGGDDNPVSQIAYSIGFLPFNLRDVFASCGIAIAIAMALKSRVTW